MELRIKAQYKDFVEGTNLNSLKNFLTKPIEFLVPYTTCNILVSKLRNGNGNSIHGQT